MYQSIRFHVPSLALAFLLCAALLPCHAAGPLVDTNGFEGFAPGALQGQQGWLTAGAGTSSATVQSAVVHSGGQALTVERTADSDRRWAKPLVAFLPQRFIVVDWDARVASTAATGSFGPFFGVEAYDDSVGNPPGLLGSLGVDATTGDVLYQAAGTGALTETGMVASFNTWNHYRLVFDYQTDQYHAFFNGEKLAATGFVDGSLNLNRITDVDIATFAAGGDALARSLTGSSQFDNFTVWDGVPGDFDVNGSVASADLATWRSAFGPSSLADSTGDGRSDGADFLIWQRQLGLNVLGPVGSITAVPEPAGLTLVLLAALGLYRQRCRR